MNCTINLRSVSFVVGAACFVLASCASFGPDALRQTRLQYNEVVKVTTEEQLLLNIVRLRYNETPSSLAVSAIAAQFERTQSAGLAPFFTSAGADISRSFTSILPQLQVGGADRPTMSLTPLDDQEFTRKLFTPLTLEGLLYLAKTTWPIATVFRLYLENLNWVSNAQTASGPTPKERPDVDDFLRGIEAMQVLQDRANIVFGVEERMEALGSRLPASSVSAHDVVEAAKAGFEFRRDEKGETWTLVKKTQQPILQIDPVAVSFPETLELVRTFHLKPGLTKYDITEDASNPFRSLFPAEGATSLAVETRSLLQALYFVSQGVEIPPDHQARGLVTVTRDEAGATFDWSQVTRGLFRVRSAPGDTRPASAYLATQFRDYWFYIDDADQDSKATFSLLLELSRLELAGKAGAGLLITLPVNGR